MYKFKVKNISGVVIHTSVRSFSKASEAQIEGNKFLNVSSLMSNRLDIAKKGNYIDVV